MSRYSERDCKVYVGDLPSDVSRSDIEDAFERYSSMKSVWVARNPPGFAFVEFDDPRDAKDACYDLDGTRICGRQIKVEISNGRSRRGGGGRGGGRDGGYGGGGYGGRGGGRGFGGDRRNETCYACGERGHFARDCKHGRRPGDGENRDHRRRSYRSRSRSQSQSPPPRRRYSRSRSRSP